MSDYDRQILESLVEVKTKVESMHEDLLRNRKMHEEHYLQMNEAMDKIGANSRLIGILEAKQESTQSELRDHKDNHWKFAGYILSFAGAVGGGIAWIIDRFGGKQ